MENKALILVAVGGVMLIFLMKRRGGVSRPTANSVRPPNPQSLSGLVAQFQRQGDDSLAAHGLYSATFAPTPFGLAANPLGLAVNPLLPVAAIACSVSNNPVCNTAAKTLGAVQTAAGKYIPGAAQVFAVTDAGGNLARKATTSVASKAAAVSKGAASTVARDTKSALKTIGGLF